MRHLFVIVFVHSGILQSRIFLVAPWTQHNNIQHSRHMADNCFFFGLTNRCWLLLSDWNLLFSSVFLIVPFNSPGSLVQLLFFLLSFIVATHLHWVRSSIRWLHQNIDAIPDQSFYVWWGERCSSFPHWLIFATYCHYLSILCYQNQLRVKSRKNRSGTYFS